MGDGRSQSLGERNVSLRDHDRNHRHTVMLYLLFEEFAGEGLAGGGMAPAPFDFEMARFDREWCNEDGVVEAP